MMDWLTYAYQLNELEAVPEKVLITMEEEYDRYLDRLCDWVGLPE